VCAVEAHQAWKMTCPVDTKHLVLSVLSFENVHCTRWWQCNVSHFQVFRNANWFPDSQVTDAQLIVFSQLLLYLICCVLAFEFEEKIKIWNLCCNLNLNLCSNLGLKRLNEHKYWCSKHWRIQEGHAPHRYQG